MGQCEHWQLLGAPGAGGPALPLLWPSVLTRVAPCPARSFFGSSVVSECSQRPQKHLRARIHPWSKALQSWVLQCVHLPGQVLLGACSKELVSDLLHNGFAEPKPSLSSGPHPSWLLVFHSTEAHGAGILCFFSSFSLKKTLRVLLLWKSTSVLCMLLEGDSANLESGLCPVRQRGGRLPSQTLVLLDPAAVV